MTGSDPHPQDAPAGRPAGTGPQLTAGRERAKPEWVRHADGYQVYSDGRDRIAYEDGHGKVVIAETDLTNYP